MRKEIQKFSILVIFMVGAIVPNGFVLAQGEAQNDWSQYNPNEKETIDHSYWGAILSKIVIEGSADTARKYKRAPRTTSKLVPSSQSSPLKKGINLIPYELVGKSIRARKAVSDYVRYLATFNPMALNKDEQLAYWLNLYNSVFVRSVLIDFPIKDMKKLGIEKRDSAEFYQKKRINIEDQSLSLYDIEKIVLLVSDNDPLAPYGMSLGSHSTPNLLSNSFTAKMVHTQLATAARKFINSFGVKTSRKSVTYSAFYDMYSEVYFSNGEAGLLQHLNAFGNDKNKSSWAKRPGLKAMKVNKKLNNMPSRTIATMPGMVAGLNEDGSFSFPAFATMDSGGDVSPFPSN